MRKFLICVFLALAVYGECNENRSTAQDKNGKPLAKDNVSLLKEPIDYSFNFDHDKINFEDGFQQTKVTVKNWLVLVNFHDDKPLNTSTTYVPRKRTLSWAVPYAIASQIYQLERVHSGLALPMDWSTKQKVKTNSRRSLTGPNKPIAGSTRPRSKVTFIFIPPSQLEFIGGYATGKIADKHGNPYRDPRYGGGVQLRLKGLPAGTVAVTLSLYNHNNGKSNNTNKLNMRALYKKALAELETKGYFSTGILNSIQEHNHPVSSVDDYHGWLREIAE